MPLVIRDADEEIYARFKAKAALRGLKIGEAITKAMEKWIIDENPPNSIEAMQNRNNFAYRRIIRDLERKFSNKWGLISNGDLVGTFEDKNQALNAIKNLSSSEPNLLFQITDQKDPRIVRLGIRRVSND